MSGPSRKTIRFTDSQLSFLEEQKQIPTETLNDVVRRVVDSYQKISENKNHIDDLKNFSSKASLLFEMVEEMSRKQDSLERELLAVLKIQTEMMSRMRDDQGRIVDHLQSFDVVSQDVPEA